MSRGLPKHGRPLAFDPPEIRERRKWRDQRIDAERQRRDRRFRRELEESTELDRIVGVERYAGPSDDTIEELLTRVMLPDGDDGEGLLEPQILSLATLLETRRLVGFITTGAGKTLITLLAMRALGLARGVALIRPDLVEQAVDEVETFGNVFNFDARLHLVSYGILQHNQHEGLLWDLRPQIIVADEAQELGNTSSARWIRVRDYCADFPETIFAPMSGSLSTTSVVDYAHLVELALGELAPLPRPSTHESELKAWARVLDANTIPRKADIAAIAELGDHFDGKPLHRVDTLTAWQREIRKAYSRRLESTPGVVIVDRASWPGTINLLERRKPELPDEVLNAIEHVLDMGETPDGEIVFASDDEAMVAVQQLVCGFYYRWDWPDSVAPDERLAWKMARGDWSRFVRHEIKERGVAGYDSPFHVTGAVARQLARKGGEPELPIEVAYVDWIAWREKLRERLEEVATRDNNGSGTKPPTLPVWVSSYLVDDCLDWLEAHRPAVLWYRHRAFGDALEAAGGGSVAVYNTRKRRMSLASILRRRGAHNCALPFACAVGRNLQRDFDTSRIAGIPPANAKTWEQVLGRFARKGQKSDEINIHVDVTNKWARNALDRAVAGAEAIRDRENMGQKLLDAVRGAAESNGNGEKTNG